MSAPIRISTLCWLGLGLALTALKLWLTRGQGVYALGYAGHDDQLFIKLAEHLVRGEWLGPYNELTLAKGPGYSIFIAVTFALGLPLFLAQHLLYAGACWAFVQALRPAITAAGWRCAIYLLLLWNPMTFDAPSMGRVLRQQIYGPLALLILAGLVALCLRRHETIRRQAPWTVLLGLAAGAFYLTREETVWLLPSALLLGGTYVIWAWRQTRGAGLRAAGLLAGALAIAALPVFIVSAQNQRYYGWFGTCEFRASAFKDAYGALLRVQVGPERPLIPVSREAREAIAEVSPAFAVLQQQFDAGLAANWAGASEFFTKIPAAEGQIGGGWMMWAFREAAAKAGYHRSAGSALKFYRRLADEVNRACDTGALPAGPRRSGFMPPWRETQTGTYLKAVRDFADFVVSFRHFSARPPASSGAPEELAQFRALTLERISPPAGELDVVGAARYILNLRKVEWLQSIGKALRPGLLVLFIVAQLLAGLRLLHAVWRRQWSFPLTVAAAAWGALAASVLMHAMIEVTSFPVLTVSSFAPVYPLILVFIAMAFWDAAVAWRHRGPAQQPAITPPVAPPAAPDSPPSLGMRLSPWLGGLAALAPVLIWHRQFGELFWFGDDLFLVDQMAAAGLWEWSGRVFSENFVPLFKILWGGAVLAFDGSYAAMLALLWLTHAANTVLLGRILARAGFPGLAVLGTQLVFALTPANIETLGWSVQWSAVLATTFLLAGLAFLQRCAAEPRGFSWSLHVALPLCACASACSFSRGVLTGPVLALGLLLPLAGDLRARAWLARLPGVLLCLLPAVAVTLVIMGQSSGNHRAMAGHWGDAAEFGLSYFLFNPGHYLLGGTSLHPAALLVLAAGKLAILAAALHRSRGNVRLLLLLLLAFDLGNAVLVGIGRYHTGFLAALSSRYQYSSLVATLPFAMLVLDQVVNRMVPVTRIRLWAATASLVVLAALCLRGWPGSLKEFTGWRGTELRQLLAAPATTDPAARVPTLDFMHVERAKALQRAYNLH